MAKRKTAPAAGRLLPRSFYSDPPEVVARGLLGKLLVRPAGSGETEALAGRIVEVEAYFGSADPAAHAFVGQTARNAVLFGPPGHAYVYFIYGMYFCLNVSCDADGRAGGVLIRALEPVAGLKTMETRRWPQGRQKRTAAGLTSGPGRLCQAFAITRALDNGVDLTSARSSLQIRDDGFPVSGVLATPRIGIRKAADRLARFILAENPHVSGFKRPRAAGCR